MIGRTLGHYRIVEKIGAGGMGVVYRAHDEKLARDVVLKVLPEHVVSDSAARERLLHEARTASALNHPHSCTIHEVGEADGQIFIAMEYVEGHPLSALISSEGLPAESVIRYGIQVADALEHAHQRGVVHRDLKSSNVVITPEGRAKILDFGLARHLDKELTAATRSRLSLAEAGSVVGTLQYMAPEVLQGKAADARSDVWSLGATLYEMAAGALPFRGETGFELTSAILRDSPRSLPASVPAGLGTVIQHCLAKTPGERYQRAGEVRAALETLQSGVHVPTAPLPTARASRRRLLGLGAGVLALVVLVALAWGWRDRLFGPAAPRIQSLAVLPLENLSGNPEQEYFSDGMTEALITELSKIKALKVISRTSVMQYKDVRKPLPEIARELGVDGVVEGSVLQVGKRVRVTAQLIHAATDKHLWADKYDRELRDILALQSEVAHAIAREIKISVAPEEGTRLAKARPVNPEAHEAYLKGRYFWNKRTEEALETSLEYFGQAIEKDPDYAAAYAGLADSYLHLAHYSGVPPQEAMAKAEAATLKALEIDPQLAEAHASLGHLRMHEWDWSASEKEFRRAIELNPNYSIVHYWYAGLLAQLGRHPEAATEFDRALELDPLSLIINERAGASRYMARQYDLAIEQFQRTLAMDPYFVPARQSLGLAYVQKGLYDEAIQELKAAKDLPGAGARGAVFLAYAYAVSGESGRALGIMNELKRATGPSRLPSYEVAAVHAALGKKDQAFAWLEKAYRERDSWLVFVKVEPMFDPLHDDPRFFSFLRRMNLAP